MSLCFRKFVEGEGGRQSWVVTTGAAKDAQDAMAFDPRKNPNASDQLLRTQMLARSASGKSPTYAAAPQTAAEALKRGWQYFSGLQCSDGHWAGDYGGKIRKAYSCQC
jgi:hypothetical protein